VPELPSCPLRRSRAKDFEPPIGTHRLEEFLDYFWGERAGRTYNKHLSGLRGFFKDAILRGKLHGDPTLAIRRARKTGVYRTVFTPDQRKAILASSPELRDQVALRLLLDYGLRKGALQRVQFKHFDHYRKQLTIFTKGDRVRAIPIPHNAFWFDLERLIVEEQAQPNHHCSPGGKSTPSGSTGTRREHRSSG
jgi:site-specific recombinase XerD